MIRWPFTNLHELNLDWIIRKMKDLEANVTAFAGKVSARAVTGAPGSDAGVSVTGDLDSGTDFVFTIPTGAQGPQGIQGIQGPQGERGSSFGHYVYTDSTATESAKVGTSGQDDPYIPADGDIIVLDMPRGNVQASMTLSIDGGTALPVFGFNGSTNPGAMADANSRLLLRYNAGTLIQIGARANSASPSVRRGGVLTDALASNLNFTTDTIEAGTTTKVLTVNKSVAQPFFIIQLWKYNGMTYELMTGGYSISGNVYASGNNTFTITLSDANTYGVVIALYGNAIVSSGM